MSLPKEIFVTHECVEDDSGYYSTSLSAEDAVSVSELETPTVGTYRLVEERELELVRTTRVRQAKKKK